MSAIGRLGITAFIAIFLSGCAAQLSAVLNRDLRTDTVSFNEASSHVIVSTTGERRMVFFARDGRVCPENFPDVGRALDTKTDIHGPVPGGSGTVQLTDQFKTTLTLTNQRSESADIIGRLGAIICVAYLNGAITPSEYAKMVDELLKGSIVRLKQAPAPTYPAATQQEKEKKSG